MVGNTSKIGIGIITCNREHFLQKCYNSLPKDKDFELIIVNDGKNLKDRYNAKIVQNTTSVNVGECKNIAIRHLLDTGCNYIFTLEDDIYFKDSSIIDDYINASNATGIQHFNFGFSQKENLDANLSPVYRKIIEYPNNVKLVLTKNILGACTFYTRKALQTIGLHHSSFNKGHGDHVELTYRAYKHRVGTPFWWFADLYQSWEKIKNQSNFNDDSIVRNQANFVENFNESRSIFKELHGVDIFGVPELPEQDVITYLKKLKNEK